MTETDTGGRSNPTRILPEKSVLEIEEYLDMQSTLGDEANFRVLYALKRIGDADSEDLTDALDMDTDCVESSLDELMDAGLAQRLVRKTPEMDEGEVYIYYQSTSLGIGLLEEGIEHLIDGEWDARERYA